jgi:hypothetical protein
VIPGVHHPILYLLPLPLHFNYYVPFRFPPLARDRGSDLNLVSYPSYTTLCSILLHAFHPQLSTRHARTTLTYSLENSQMGLYWNGHRSNLSDVEMEMDHELVQIRCHGS